MKLIGLIPILILFLIQMEILFLLQVVINLYFIKLFLRFNIIFMFIMFLLNSLMVTMKMLVIIRFGI